MFLSLTWCIISDIDINSEVLRSIGSSRFTIYGLYRLMRVRHYQGKLMYNGKKIESNKPEDFVEIKQQFKEEQLENSFKHLIINNCSWCSFSINITPLSRLDDGTNDIILMTSDKSRWQLTKLLLNQDDGLYFNG